MEKHTSKKANSSFQAIPELCLEIKIITPIYVNSKKKKKGLGTTDEGDLISGIVLRTRKL